MKTITCSLLLLLLLCGCRLGPRYVPPTPDTPNAWKAPTQEAPGPAVDYWWEVFNDDTLNELEIQAITHSYTLDAAYETIIQARAFAGVQRSYLFPQLNLDPLYSDTGELTKIFLPPVTGLPPIPPVFRIHTQEYRLPLDLSYQVDLWGKYRGQYDSEWYNAQAQDEAFQAAMLTLTSDLASAYFQLRSLDAQIDLLQATIDVRRKNYNYNKSRFDKGLVPLTDVTQASVEVSNAESDFYETKRLRTLQENAIAILIGVPPAELCLEHAPLKVPPPTIPAGIPSDVLLQRPDIAQVEREVASEQALIGVAYASFFPSLTLTGTLGYSSPDLRDFLRWQSRLWSIGGAITQNIFDGGRNEENLISAWSSYRQSVDNYQQQVLIAFREVEDALNDLEWQAKRADSLQRSVDASKKTVELSTRRYLHGIVTYLEVVTSERSELESEQLYIILLGNQYLSTIQLIKALGGTWMAGQDCTDYTIDNDKNDISQD